MKMPRSRLLAAVVSLAAAALLVNGPLQAADGGAAAADHANHAEQNTAAIEGKGVVKTIDANANTITLAHEAIPAINWPAMTMQFKVLGNAEEQLEVGDEVTFELQGDGSDSTITKIQKAE